VNWWFPGGWGSWIFSETYGLLI